MTGYTLAEVLGKTPRILQGVKTDRAETRKLEFNPQFLDLPKVCRQLVEEIRLSTGAKHNINFVCQGQVSNAYLDEKLWRSIITNLLSNAIKYSASGSNIYFTLKGDLSQVNLQIKDERIGILEDDRKQLFEAFHRGKNVRNIPGTGLGLVVVKKCVELHGGSIYVHSEVGVGTTFMVNLPLSKCSGTS